jgi:outer membrane receptor for ferrienterochelin and colicins
VRAHIGLTKILAASASALALSAVLAQANAAPADADAAAGATGEAQTITVTAKLNEARDAIQPGLGASVYTLDNQAIQALPGGDNLALNQVVLQAPGVAQDSFGQLHVRGEHNGLQYRLNGIILPEGLSVFGQALNPRLADKVQLITGALPAQYGLRTAGIINITTKSGSFNNGGAVSLYGGSHGEVTPSFEYGGSSGDWNFFVSGSYLRSKLGVESPDGRSTPHHDATDQWQGFAYVERTLNENSRVAGIFGTSSQRFQIPDQAGQTPGLMYGPNSDQPLVVNGQTSYNSLNLNENQHEVTHYGVLSYLYAADRFTGQVSLFGRYSTLDFSPDVQGDLLFNGVAQEAHKSDAAGGLQAEAVYDLTSQHTLRSGLIVQFDRSASQTSSHVIALDANNSQLSDQPKTIIDNSAKTSKTYSLYLQDEWKPLDRLTLNYGLRLDDFHGYRHENQLSPRVNAVWNPLRNTTIHAGYSRYFSPPPFELVAAPSVAKFNNTTAAASSNVSTTPYAERANYIDVGFTQKLWRHFSVGLDYYNKTSRHLVDEGQFGAPIILTPFNYQKGKQYGLELSTSYNNGPFSAYANAAWERAMGMHIITSEFNFSADDLAYIQNHYIYLDHDQTWTGSAGAAYKWGDTRFSGDLVYGSGLRASKTLASGVVIPNGAALPNYIQVNASVSHHFAKLPFGPFDVRLDAINLFDKQYQIRNGTGVGVGAPQFGPRQGVFVGIRKEL